MEQENDTPTPIDEAIIWPKGRQLKNRRPKFGSNKKPLGAVPSPKLSKREPNEGKNG